MIILVSLISSLRCACLPMLQNEVSKIGMGILNRECAVRPPSNRRAAIAEDATQRAGLFVARTAAAIVLQT